MRVLITGAAGFIGSKLSSSLEAKRHQLLLAARDDMQIASATVSIDDIDSFDNWRIASLVLMRLFT